MLVIVTESGTRACPSEQVGSPGEEQLGQKETYVKIPMASAQYPRSTRRVPNILRLNRCKRRPVDEWTADHKWRAIRSYRCRVARVVDNINHWSIINFFA